MKDVFLTLISCNTDLAQHEWSEEQQAKKFWLDSSAIFADVAAFSQATIAASVYSVMFHTT